MKRFYANVQMASEVVEALEKLRVNFSDQAYQSPNVVGMGSAIAVLVAHYLEHPPELAWEMAKVKEMPRRGRPKKP